MRKRARETGRGSGPCGRRARLPALAARRGLVTLILAGIAALAASVAASPHALAQATAAARLSLRLDGPIDPSHGGVLVALRKGFFARESIEAEIRPGDGDAVSRVEHGEDTIGLASADAFLLARERGAPIVAFAAGLIETPVLFLAREGARIQKPADFAEKRVGIESGQTSEIIYRALLTKLNVSRSRIQEIAGGADVEALLAGRVDVIAGTLATLQDINQRGRPVAVIRPASYGLHLPGTVYFTHERTWRKDPALIRGFLRAVIAGWDAAYAHPEGSIALVASWAPGLPSTDEVRFVFTQQRDLIRPLARRVAEFDLTQWRTLRQILAQQKLLTDPVDLAAAVTLEPLQDVYRKPITYGR
jgi:NitT/TauT family transport system substrate-binding protein